jgi:hypothetical protein
VVVAALGGEGLGCVDDGGADAVGLSVGWPDGQAVDLGAVGVAFVHLGSRASVPPDFAGSDWDVVDPGGQECAQSLLLVLEACFVVASLPGGWVVVFQQGKVVLSALPDAPLAEARALPTLRLPGDVQRSGQVAVPQLPPTAFRAWPISG